MRVIAYSMMVLAGVSIWEMKSVKHEANGIAVTKVNAEQGVDTMVTGGSIDDQHRAEWEARNRIKKVCDGCRVYTQPFPGDVDDAAELADQESVKKD